MKDRKHALAVVLWSLITITGGAALLWVLSIPSDPKNEAVWGLSAERLLMVVVILVLMFVGAFMAWSIRFRAVFSRTSRISESRPCRPMAIFERSRATS